MNLCYHPESDCAYLGEPDEFAHDTSASWLPAGTVIQNVGLTSSTVHPSMDFETRSHAGYVIDQNTGKIKGVGPQGKGGLPVVGAPVYAEDPTTDVLSLYYDLKDGKGRRFWAPGLPYPQDLLGHIADGGPIEAHNMTFEFWIWNMICVRRYGWPPLELHQCHCSAAKARRYSLPGALAKAADVLGTLGKDPDGDRLLRKLSRPHTPTKNRPSVWWTPATAWEDFKKLYAYNDRDVEAEDELSARIPDLTPDERATWIVDQTINARGVHVDVESLDACLRLMEEAYQPMTLELAQITQGAVGSVSEVQRILDWLAAQGCRMIDLTADTVDEALESDVRGPTRRVLEIRQCLGGANIKKLHTLKRQLNSDNRLRDQYMYCGADRTGRWSAGGVQLQNITAKGPRTVECKDCGRIAGNVGLMNCPECGSLHLVDRKEWTVEAVEFALSDIRSLSYEHVTRLWGDPAKLLAGCLRGLFTSRPGYDLIGCDFSAIEAVVAACLARCQWRIDVFATHGKIYEMSASKITGTPLSVYEKYKAENRTHHPDRKNIGKIAELASGYGGWVGAWKNFGADMPDDEIKRQVLAWREASPEIVEMWGGQFIWCGPGKWDYRPGLFGLEGMAIAAIQNPGQCFSYIDITYGVHNDVLFCRLPSGRFLHYHRPRLVEDVDRLNRGPCWKITFEGYNSNPQKGPVGWQRMETYGGKLFENVVQAVSADIQAEAIKRLEQSGYPVVMHTHDEAVAEVPEGVGSVEEMERIMSVRPTWANWWPIKAAGWRHKRYQKD